MEDPLFKGNQNFHFEMDLDALGERMFGGEANAGVSFQIGQLRYVLLHNECILVLTKYILHFNMYLMLQGWGLNSSTSDCGVH